MTSRQDDLAQRYDFRFEERVGAVAVLPMHGARKAYALQKTPFIESAPAFSPDGRWIAYRSNESGEFEIYVQP